VLSFSRALNKNQVDIVIVRRTWRATNENIARRLLITALINKDNNNEITIKRLIKTLCVRRMRG
jgi:hypothetical protein